MGSRRHSKGDRLRVAVLMGGTSSEHDVSLVGGAKVVDALDPERYDVRPIVISKDGRWHVPSRPGHVRKGPDGDGFDPHQTEGWKTFHGALDALCHLADWPADVAMPVLHGRFGEDGTVQACLAAAGIPFVGSGSAASALAMDKVRTKEVLLYHGFSTPPFEELFAEDLRPGLSERAEALVKRHGTPLVLKDPTGGSSLEVRIADDAGEVAAAIQELVPPARRLMAEAFVEGRELTVGVIQDREQGLPLALPVVEIRSRTGRCFDYRAKYEAGGAEELCPAPIPEEVEAECRRIGLAVHRILGLSGISRTDLILDGAGRLQVLEVNTLPGMTETSLVPLAARAVGLSFEALVENLLRTAGEG